MLSGTGAMAGDDLAQARGQGITSYDIDLPSNL